MSNWFTRLKYQTLSAVGVMLPVNNLSCIHGDDNACSHVGDIISFDVPSVVIQSSIIKNRYDDREQNHT